MSQMKRDTLYVINNGTLSRNQDSAGRNQMGIQAGSQLTSFKNMCKQRIMVAIPSGAR